MTQNKFWLTKKPFESRNFSQKIFAKQNVPPKHLFGRYFGSEKVLGPKNFCVQKIKGQKKKKFWVQKMFGPKKILSLQKFGSKMNLGPNKFWIKKWVKKMLGLKKFGSKKILGRKRFGSK